MKTNKKGFTLVELLAVIVILAIILAIAIPGIGNIINTAKRGAFESDVKMMLKDIELKTFQSTIDTTVTPPAEGNFSAFTYGGVDANYTLLCITDLTPTPSVCAQSDSNSKFGAQSKSLITKNSVTPNSDCTCPTP